MSIATFTLVVTILAAMIGGLATWLFQDLRRRLGVVEERTQLNTTAMFYMVMSSPDVPTETKRALEEAMRQH